MNGELSLREKDIFRLIQSNCHIGARNFNVQMKRYIHHIDKNGVPIFNINETYDKIRLAARIIAGMDPKDVLCVSSKENGQRAVVKFSQLTGCDVAPSGKWCSGTLTNHQTKKFREPKLLIVVDPHADFKPIKEGSYMNIPVISLCDTKNSLKYIDVVIPCNNDLTNSIAQVFWMLTRELFFLNNKIGTAEEFEPVVDLFDFREIKTGKDADDENEGEGDDDDEGDSEEGEKVDMDSDDDEDEDEADSDADENWTGAHN